MSVAEVPHELPPSVIDGPLVFEQAQCEDFLTLDPNVIAKEIATAGVRVTHRDPEECAKSVRKILDILDVEHLSAITVNVDITENLTEAVFVWSPPAQH